jgi:hypothetical protein
LNFTLNCKHSTRRQTTATAGKHKTSPGKKLEKNLQKCRWRAGKELRRKKMLAFRICLRGAIRITAIGQHKGSVCTAAAAAAGVVSLDSAFLFLSVVYFLRWAVCTVKTNETPFSQLPRKNRIFERSESKWRFQVSLLRRHFETWDLGAWYMEPNFR